MVFNYYYQIISPFPETSYGVFWSRHLFHNFDANDFIFFVNFQHFAISPEVDFFIFRDFRVRNICEPLWYESSIIGAFNIFSCQNLNFSIKRIFQHFFNKGRSGRSCAYNNYWIWKFLRRFDRGHIRFWSFWPGVDGNFAVFDFDVKLGKRSCSWSALAEGLPYSSINGPQFFVWTLAYMYK